RRDIARRRVRRGHPLDAPSKHLALAPRRPPRPRRTSRTPRHDGHRRGTQSRHRLTARIYGLQTIDPGILLLQCCRRTAGMLSGKPISGGVHMHRSCFAAGALVSALVLAAAAQARGPQPGALELPGSRTATSSTYLNPDGSYTAV